MAENHQNLNIHISNRSILRVIIAGVLVLALMKLWSLVLVILTAIVVASFVESGVKKLKIYIKNRTIAVLLIYLFSIGIVAGLMSVFIPVFITEMSSLVSQLGQYLPDTSIWNTFQPDTVSGARDLVSNVSKGSSLTDIIKSTQGFIHSISGGFFSIFGSAFGGIFNLILIIIISFYLSIQEKGIENFLRIVVPLQHEDYVISLWQRTEYKIGLWMQGQMVLGVIIGMLTYLALTILGVKYSLVLALLTAVTELIPFGMIIAVVPAIAFGFIDGGITLALMILGVYVILQQFENYLLYPLIVKKATGISPLVVILSLLIGAQLAGFWGIILAIPCAVFLFEYLDDLEKKKTLSRMN